MDVVGLSEFVLGFTEMFLCPLLFVNAKIVVLPAAYQLLMFVESLMCLKAQCLELIY
jgi:hypothetical protein